MLPNELSVNDILRKLDESNSPQTEQLQDLLNRNIPITPCQANLLYLNRGYGKTWMSYIRTAQKLLRMAVTQPYVIISTSLGADISLTINEDPDLTSHIGKAEWLIGFKSFINKYYPELILQYNDSTFIKLIYKLKD